MPLTDTLANISDTITGVQSNFDSEAPSSTTYELTDEEIKRRYMIRVIIVLIIIGVITGLIIRSKVSK